jgi:hypothetical protein
MLVYPPIAHATGQAFREFDAYVFDKIDGSNLRAEWSRKRGWYKFGTRERLVDGTDPDFGEAPALFSGGLADRLEKIARKARWNNLVVFMEFWGKQSFAGLHVSGDPKSLTVFDAAPDRGDLLGPREFLDYFEAVPIPGFLGRFHWTRGFVERVRLGEIGPITLEGVVGKAMIRRELFMAKAKTQKWIDQVRARYAPEAAEKLISS